MYVNNLSFDPCHQWFEVPGLPGAQWAIEVFTTDNAFGLDPALTTVHGGGVRAAGMQWLGGQRQLPGQVEVTVDADKDGGVSWRIGAETSSGSMKGVKLLVRGLSADLQRSGWWTPTTAVGHTLTPIDGTPLLLSYPWESWQTPWVCAGEGPALTVSIRDGEVRAKRFYAYHPHWSPTPVVEIVCDQLATRRGPRFDAPPIRLRLVESASHARADFLEHLQFVEASFDLVSFEQRTDVPAWAEDLQLVLMLHGQHWTGYVFNTFDQMGAILEDITADLPGDRILAYLPGWEGRYYRQYPIYEPSADLGGVDGFARLVATAKRLGVHLMPMFGANGAHVQHYPDWQQATFRSPADRYPALINTPDWDNDRAGEDDQCSSTPPNRPIAHIWQSRSATWCAATAWKASSWTPAAAGSTTRTSTSTPATGR